MTDSPGTSAPPTEVDPLTVFDPARREAGLRSMTRIVLGPIGSPMPLGFFTVAIDSVLASALPKRALAAVLVVAVPWFLIAGIAELTGSQGVSQASAVLGFLLAAVAMYTAFDLLMEDSRGREVLPIGWIAMARHTTHGNLAMQLRDIKRQADVRRTL
jgi:uncharacterized protein